MPKVFYLFFFIPLAIGAQNPQLAKIHFSPNEGLPSSEVYDLLQDQNGYIWIATDNGLSRFNGYRFDNFGSEDGLLNNVIFSLREDHQEKIWMSTISGSLYFFQSDTIQPYPFNHILKKYNQRNNFFNYFYFDESETLYVGLENRILIIDKKGQSEVIAPGMGVLVYEVDDQLILGLSVNDSDAVPPFYYFDNMGVLWLYQNKQLNKKKIPLINDPKWMLIHYRIHQLASTKKLLSLGSHLYSFDNQQVFPGVQFSENIISILETKRNKVYIGLLKGKNKGGVLVYPDTSNLSYLSQEKYLINNSIADVLEDQMHGLWFATGGNGIFYSPNPDFKIYNKQSGLSDNYIRTISLKSESEIFVGLNDGNTYHLDIKNQSLQLIFNIDHEIHDLKYDQATGDLWLGAPVSYKKTTDTWQAVSQSRNLSYGLKKFDLYPSGNLWGINFGANGFSKYDLTTAKILANSRKKDFLQKRTFCVYEDFEERVWIGRSDGLLEFKNDTLLKPKIDHPAFDLRIEEIKQLRDSTFILGTKGSGILLWKGNSVLQIDQKKGLTSNMIEKIHIDSTQNIWVGTLNGLNQIVFLENNQFKIYTYTTANGLPSNEITDIDSWGKHIWVATNKGLTYIPNIKKTISNLNRKPIIETTLVNGEELAKSNSNIFSYWQSNIQFKYFTIDYSQNGNIKYRYRLQPTDQWNYTKDISVNYAALSPDNYSFEIQSANKLGQWSNSTIFSFTINSPFWKTTWFISIGIISIIMLIFSLYKYQIKQIRTKANFEKNIHELRQAALRAQMNPHFIFNCLNSIQGFIIVGDNVTATDYLSRFARLIRSVLNTSQQKLVPLEEEVSLLQHYTFLENLRMEQPFDFKINIDPKIDSYEVCIPPLLTQPLIENAIIHGLSNLKRKGKIEVSYQLINQQLKINIKDNGNGILNKNTQNSNSFFHQSLGIEIIQKRLAFHNKNHIDKPFISFHSLSGVPDWEQGTEVILSIYFAG